VTRGVLFLAAANAGGPDLPGTSFDGPGGFAQGIDQALRGVNGLAHGGYAGQGRRSGGSFGFGPASGGGTDNSVDALMRELMSSPEGSPIAFRPPRPRPHPVVPTDPTGTGTYTVNGRSRAEISSVVYANLPALRHAYSMRLRMQPRLGGRITVKFLIDDKGRVFAVSVVDSNTGDTEFDQLILAKIRAWRFEVIDKPGDMTEVVYPFVFSR
jgi:TonB family protein